MRGSGELVSSLGCGMSRRDWAWYAGRCEAVSRSQVAVAVAAVFETVRGCSRRNPEDRSPDREPGRSVITLPARAKAEPSRRVDAAFLSPSEHRHQASAVPSSLGRVDGRSVGGGREIHLYLRLSSVQVRDSHARTLRARFSATNADHFLFVAVCPLCPSVVSMRDGEDVRAEEPPCSEMEIPRSPLVALALGHRERGRPGVCNRIASESARTCRALCSSFVRRAFLKTVRAVVSPSPPSASRDPTASGASTTKHDVGLSRLVSSGIVLNREISGPARTRAGARRRTSCSRRSRAARRSPSSSRTARSLVRSTSPVSRPIVPS